METVDKEAKKRRKEARHKSKRIFLERKSTRSENWLGLDNAALIYPAIATSEWSAVYRFSAYLYKDVVPETLQQALNVVLPRFPSLNVYIRRGLFWFYFEQLTHTPTVKPETANVCKNIAFRPNRALFRVRYHNNKITLECFHALTDGVGSSNFFTCLIAKYLQLTGENVDISECPINILDKPDAEELEDSFERYADFVKCNARKEEGAYQIPGTETERLNAIIGVMSASALNAVAKGLNCTITQLLIAAYAKALLNYSDWRRNRKLPIKISVPINCRAFLPSQTQRNFSSYINLIFRPGENASTIEELIGSIKDQMSVINADYLIANINSNVKAQKNPIVRIMPLAIKNAILKIVFRNFGENLFTTAISNLGRVKVPSSFNGLVDRYEAMLGRGVKNTINCGCVTVNDKLSISFTSKIGETRIQRDFFRFLSSLGVDITITSNLLEV